MKATRIVACLAALLVCGSAFGQQDFSSVEIERTRVARGLFMLTGEGGNIGLSVGDDGAFIVDTQYAPLSEKILAAVRAARGGDVKFVVNTHYHGDHTGGNANMARAGATIMAQDNVKTRLSTPQVSPVDGSAIPASPREALPVVTFADRMTFHYNGVTVDIYHVPHAHTDGDSIVHYKELNAFHMGDTFFNGGYPLIDTDAGGSILGFIAAAEGVLSMSDEDTRIIPGHGDLARQEDLRSYLGMLRAVRDSIQPLVDQGLNEDQVVAAHPTAALDEQWGAGFVNPELLTRRVYRSLSR
jgi:cyclase